ncbi:GNAT family protein [Ferrovibrio terrae]|uniref:GNAT family N-acetyltransferase n=1 Tax=Ferrovibrio terrae TaxID=2594003 RepID=UPI003137B794
MLTAKDAIDFIKGDKINLRGMRREDLPLYANWIDNREATKFMETGWRPAHETELEAIFKTSTEAPDHAIFTIIDKASNKAIGVAGLYLIHWICRRAEFRILIGDSAALGRGYGSEACDRIIAYGFEHLNLELIYLGVNCANIRAVRSYEKSGFVTEGIRRKLIYRNGQYYDAQMMSILREEYEARKATSGK